MLRFDCPTRQATLEGPEERLGSTIDCPNCTQPHPSAPAPKPQARVAPSKPLSASASPSPRNGAIAWICGLFLVVVGFSAAGTFVWLDNGRTALPATLPLDSPTSLPDFEPSEWGPPAPAAPLREARVEETIVVDRKGDAWVARAFQFPLQTYTALRNRTTNIALLERDFRFHQHWQQVEELKAHFDDRASSLVVRWQVRGFARQCEADLWRISLPDDLNLVHARGNVAILSGKTTNEMDVPAVLNRRVEIQDERAVLALRSAPARLEYRLAAPSPAASAAASVKFHLEVKPTLLACLGQLYGKGKQFPDFWVARAVLRNTGGQTLRNYRVRFRLEGFTASPDEHRCDQVVPGQTVVDASFPTLDLGRLADLTTPSEARLVAEYEYEVGGVVVRDRQIRRVQLLSRNQIPMTDLPAEETTTHVEPTRILPFVLAART